MLGAIGHAAGQVWPPFVLVSGLLLIGAVVESDGLFEAIGSRIEQAGGGAAALLAELLALDAAVTAALNLDTAAVFVTPIIVHAARQRRCDERPFLYGALFMANSASLLLAGSNLTNLIVLAHARLSGAAFARAMALPWVAASVLTIAFLTVVFRPTASRAVSQQPPPLHLGLGATASAVAIVLMLALHNAALAVLAVGIAAVSLRRLRPRLSWRTLGGLFLLAVAFGTLAQRWSGPASAVGAWGGVGSALVGALASVGINNLPAAALLAARPPSHPLALLIGLNLGPNLAVTGSLSAYLWYRAAVAAGTRPSLRYVSVLGVALVPLTMAAALAALALVEPHAV